MNLSRKDQLQNCECEVTIYFEGDEAYTDVKCPKHLNTNQKYVDESAVKAYDQNNALLLKHCSCKVIVEFGHPSAQNLSTKIIKCSEHTS